MDDSAMSAEYLTATHQLMLPPGRTWPPPPTLPPAPDGKGIMRDNSYGKGWGASTAEQIWACSWRSEWLEQRGKDSERERIALESMLAYKETATYIEHSDDSTRQWEDRLLAQAELGDPSLVQQHVKLNCQS